MPIILNIAAIVALASGLAASFVIQSDVRWEIVATCWIGGFLLMGSAYLLERIARIERLLIEQASAEDTARRP